MFSRPDDARLSCPAAPCFALACCLALAFPTKPVNVMPGYWAQSVLFTILSFLDMPCMINVCKINPGSMHPSAAKQTVLSLSHGYTAANKLVRTGNNCPVCFPGFPGDRGQLPGTIFGKHEHMKSIVNCWCVGPPRQAGGMFGF